MVETVKIHIKSVFRTGCNGITQRPFAISGFFLHKKTEALRGFCFYEHLFRLFNFARKQRI